MTFNINRKLNNLTQETEEPKQEVILSEEQKTQILSAWKNAPRDNPPSLKELTKLVFPDKALDGRSLEGKAVRDFLATYNVSPPRNVHEKIGPHILTVAEKEFIQNNIDQIKPLEMCKTLWPAVVNMSPLSKEFRAVSEFINSLNYKPGLEVKADKTIMDAGNFIPPKTYTECFRLVQKYTHEVLNMQEISEREKGGVMKLIAYLHAPRFLQMVNTYQDEKNRELFLSEVIRSTYNKPDLSSEELNQYFSLASDITLSLSIQAQIELLNIRLGEIMEDPDGKLSVTLAETISAKTKEYNDCLSRQRSLIKELNGSRATRLKNQLEANASVLSLMEYWKDEKKRKKLIQLANIRKQAVRDCVDELISMDSIKAEMFGSQKLF